MVAPSSVVQEPRAGIRVLFVEDEWLLRATVSDFLEDSGHTVIGANSADDAVTLLTDGLTVDLVITDIRMPGRLDGVGLAFWLQQHRPGLPVILASGTLKLSSAEASLPHVRHR